MSADRHDGGHNEHQQVWTLFPWVANGTANADQIHAVRAHLAGCPACRAEFEREQSLHAALATPSYSCPDVDQGFERLRRRLDNASDGAAVSARQSWWRRLRELSGPGLVGIGLIEAVALALLLTTGGERAGSGSTATGQEAYRTLSDADRVTPVRASLRLVFDGGRPVSELARLLQTHGLVVVDGPSEAGVWSIGFAHGEGDAEKAAKDLRSAAGVLFAEPVGLPQP